MKQSKDGLYAVYLRKSRADLEKERFGKFETLAIHQQELEELARREGYALETPYYKELVSGEHIAERFEFQRLMECVKAGRYRGILVHAVARLGRGDPQEYGWILSMLRITETLIVTPHKVYDPNDEDDARYLQMEMFVSNMELGNIRSRLVSGMRAAAKAGCFIRPQAPYGYDRFRRDDGKWTLVQNDDASTVKLIFERAASGTPLGTIARDLNATGMRTQCGGFWSTGRIRTILKNPHYKGMIRFSYWSDKLVPDEGFKVKRVRQKNENYIYVDGLHEGIVSDEVWEAANNRDNGSAPVLKDYTLKNPLAGLLVCKKCGRAMVRFLNKVKTSGNVYEHYRHAAFTDCKTQGARQDVVVDLLCEALEEIANDYEFKTEEAPDTSKEELASINRQLNTASKHLDKLVELYCAELITIDEFRKRKESSEQTTAQLQERKAELEVEHPTPKQMQSHVRDAIRLLKSPDVDADIKNAALKSFIDRIEYENFTPPRSRDYDIRLKVILKS